jgi:GH3 auxin-responsive promoter
MSLAPICNTFWMATCYREAQAYARDSKKVNNTQLQLLRQIVRRNCNTIFGREHGFATIKNVRDFQRAVPLSDYDDYREATKQIADGEQGVLTADRVRLLEPTSGSVSGEKLIPYTAALRRSFQRAIRLWIWDLFSKRSAVRRGRSYWSISPLAQVGRRTKGGISIGFDDDAAYLSLLERCFVRKTIVVPREMAVCRSVSAAQYATLFLLLRADDLALISVWSPTFLTELLNLLWARRECLCNDLASGRITLDCAADGGPVTERRYLPLRERVEYVRSVFRGAEHISQCIPAIWPSLALVSCWADGPALAPANYLRHYLPGIEIQPKGLLATEAFVTVPLVSYTAPALAIRSHFFEFQPIGLDGGPDLSHPLLADELSEGSRYRVIVTNAGGLYRYHLQDEVEVVGFANQAPLLRFIGKTDDVSDLVGEKLSAAHIDSVLRSAFRELQLAPTFAQLCVERRVPPNYRLRIAMLGFDENSVVKVRLCDTIERGLRANPGYLYARELGQLAPLTIEWLDQRQADAICARRTAEQIAAGRRLGDVKPSTMCHRQS